MTSSPITKTVKILREFGQTVIFDGEIHLFDLNKATEQINQLIIDGKNEVLDELLEWHDFWSRQHQEPFNWYGAVKALKISKDFKKPFVELKEQKNG